MPATAGRVRMPADNRISVSASLKTSEIWQKSVGYDPYAPVNTVGNTEENIGNNDKARGLFELALLTGASSSVTPGACRKCGHVGHLTHQCRNLLPIRGKDLINVKPSINHSNEDEKKLRKKLGLEEHGTSSSSSNSSRSRSSDSSSSTSSYKRKQRKRKNIRKKLLEHKKKKSKHHKKKESSKR